MSGSLIFTGLNGMSTAHSALATTAHNTANIKTKGYTRQVAEISTNGARSTGAGYIGSGARVTTVTRSYDEHLTAQLASAQSNSAALESHSTQIDRISSLLADSTTGLSPLMQSFFTAVQGVANAPADSAARQQLISSAEALANKFRATDQFMSELGDSVNEQITGSIQQVNSYAKEIAGLNKQISLMTAVAGGQPPNDLLDQRDLLVSELNQIVDAKVVRQDGGKYNVFIGTGQSLVVGDRAAKMQAVPSSADPTRTAVALVGVAGNVSELKNNALAGGKLGGLVNFRAQTLMPTQNAIGRLSLTIADSFNAQHKLGADLGGALGGDFFQTAGPGVFTNDRNGGDMVLTASISDSSELSTSDYVVQVKDVDGTLNYNVTRVLDDKMVGTYTSMPIEFDGVKLATASGTAKSGDSFLVQPTRYGARDINTLVKDPAKVAAASPVISGNAAGNQGSGKISPAAVDAAYLDSPLAANVTLTYANGGTLSGFPAASAVTVTQPDGSSTDYTAGQPVPFSAGAELSFGGITVTLSGKPAAGDTFSIRRNVAGISDGTNALALGALQREALVGGRATSFNGAYSQLVSEVGNRAAELNIAKITQKSVSRQIEATQQSISGVNLDEETANLVFNQRMYQANAKVIQVASAIFDALLGIRS